MFERRRQQKGQAANSTGPQQKAANSSVPWQDGHAAVQFGAVWVLVGLVSYITLSLLARAALHAPQALQQQQEEVPSYVYDRSLFVFGTAFLLDVLGLLFELKSSRLDVVLLPAFVKGAATLTNILARSGWATVAYGGGGRLVMVQRFICWLHTTPTILVLVKMMATNITRQQAVRAVVCVEVMCLTGLLGSLTAGWWAVFWGGLSHLAFLPILPYLHQGLKEASAVVSLHAARRTMTIVYYLTMVMWVGFGVVWDLRVLGLIDTYAEEVAYLFCDFSAKVMFSAGLMLSSFKGLDSRREVVMRQIQEEHKQTLILELKRAIEQKDAFMSSVSHELRTPLNGIIGISEGLLANCCGPLSESVRKQLFIVRTSGARLLALINDVMDAATLRQHRLVLKQERLELRQVVGDVVDLTRSLVDLDVSLRNDVPEGLEVWADSGRIIQILNNLLGNAAKFTHQGSIRVSAKWHDEQRQWVVITVTDTGIGIPKQKLQSIFLPFEQVDGSISRQYGGFGLGLSITQELVRAHGGELWVKSKEHKGSQLAFTIPSFTGQTPLTPQQQQQLQLQSRRSTPLGRASRRLGTAEVSPVLELAQRRSSSRGALPPPSPPGGAAAAAGGEDGNCNGVSSPADKQLIAAVNGAAAVAAGLEGEETAGVVSSPLTAELLDSCVGEDFAAELPYDAAQLSALASSKPFTSHKTASSSSSSGSLQRVGSEALRHANSMLSMASAAVDGETLGITPVPNRDQRPSQFACTGRYQILSVDDDLVNQTVVQSLLASTGYEVVCLYNGQSTLEYIENASVLPDLILLDMLMPDMSGPEVCRQLALRQPPLNVPIILVSALAEESSVVTGLDSGADDYITKPFRRAEFLARIRGKLQIATANAAAEQARQAAAPGSAGVVGEQRVVMCVTDDEVNHIVLEGILQSQNYRYLKVSSGAEALKLLQAAGSKPPHLVLLDAALPDTTDTTGLEVLQTLRLQYSQVALPVIMMTARHNEKAIVQALDAGANDYAVKPFRRSELLARIRMHLRSSQKAAAAASPAAERHSAELRFAGDVEEELLSAELQRSVRVQQLSSVPLLVIQLGGVSEALAGATAEQACQLTGFIADCFDALVEKYAVIKVEASDTSLTVAAPLSVSSTSTSARNSFQLPILQLSTPGNSNASLPVAARAADLSQQQADGAAAGAGGTKSSAGQGAAVAVAGASMPPAVHAGGLAAAMLQLLQMAQELQAYLSIECCSSQGSSSAGSSTPAAAADAAGTASRADSPQQQQQPATAAVSSFAQPSVQNHQQQQGRAAVEGGMRARPRTPLQLLQPQAPQWWHGQIQVHMALHVGPVTAGVVGRRRPRYRLMGPALQAARQACAEAPANHTVATADAAQLLQASGVQSLRQLAGSGSGGGSGGGVSQLQLWVLSAGAVVPALQQATVSAGTAGVLGRAAAVLAGTAGQPAGPSLMKIGSVELPVSAAAGTPSAAAGPARATAEVNTQPSQQQPPLLPPQSLQQQQQQQQQFLPSGICLPAQPLGVQLPPLPPLLDPAVQQSQQLLKQELSALAQQLAAVSAGASMVAPGSGMQLPWNHTGCNGLSTAAVVSVLNLDSSAGQVAGFSQSAGLTTAAAGAVTQGVVASAAAPVDMSLSLSLHDWQASPMKGALMVPGGSASLRDYAAGTDGSGGVACSVPSSVLATSILASAVPGVVGLQDAAAAVGVPVEVQLGASELQQISLLHQELATLQVQIASAMGGGAPFGPTNGLAQQHVSASDLNGHSAGVQPHGFVQQQQQQYGLSSVPYQARGSSEARASLFAGSSSTPIGAGSGGAADVPAVAAAAAGHGVQLSSVSSSVAGSYAAVESDQAPVADSSAETSLKAQQACGVGVKGRSKSGQLFGQLFRRRSSRKQQHGQQQLSQE